MTRVPRHGTRHIGQALGSPCLPDPLAGSNTQQQLSLRQLARTVRMLPTIPPWHHSNEGHGRAEATTQHTVAYTLVAL